jgi:NAD(P)-dependent dehydrogenase (short-subunit alcohol dehydrogenase family)
MHWNFDDVGDLTGKVCIVTGANTGLGFSDARMLAQKHATVILACRNTARAAAAVAQIRASSPSADARAALLDLSSLASVREFAGRILSDYPRLDLLINNAGVMMPPKEMTLDGFESQFAINYLGHFLLTRLLLPLLDRSPPARVVSLSSLAHRGGRIDLENLNAQVSYSRWNAYAQSKLACLMFALELQRRLDAAGSATLSLAAHPGATSTELARHSGIMRMFSGLLSQPTDAGALPTLRAAIDPAARGGQYYGPAYLSGLRGPPVLEAPKKQALDEEVSKKLWAVSERLLRMEGMSV